MKRVKLYLDDVTGNWMVQDHETEATHDLEELLSVPLGDSVLITNNKIPVSRVKGFKVVTGNEAVELVIQGHKLYTNALDSYVKIQEYQLKSELVWRDLYDNDHTPIYSKLNYDYVRKNQWLVKE
ncbi:hypothetical protein ACQUY5_30235 [Bacillus cereus]|uniref:hypothetical protein n=1 Tax=Bacillus cereus TaxID=1396 RepID=UPI003D17C28A